VALRRDPESTLGPVVSNQGMEKAINCNLAKVVSGLGINQSELMEKGKAYAIPCRPEAKTKVILAVRSECSTQLSFLKRSLNVRRYSLGAGVQC